MIKCQVELHYLLTLVSYESLVWLKFGKFGEIQYFAKLCSFKTLILSNYISGKFAKLYVTKLIAMQFHQPLATPNPCWTNIPV